MSPSRPQSVTLRSNSPRHREVLHQRDEHRRRDDYTYSSTIHINLNLGMTITTNNLQFPTSRTTMTTPPTLSTAPQKSGSPGSLGKTSPSLNITRIPPDGSTIQSRTTNINLMMNRLPSILQSL